MYYTGHEDTGMLTESSRISTIIDTTAIRLMIRNAMVLPLSSGAAAGISSNTLNNVLVERHANTQNNASDNMIPAIWAPVGCVHIR